MMYLMLVSTGVNVLSIIAIMALPLGMLHCLQMKRIEKLGLAAIFCLGWLEIALDITRILQWKNESPLALSLMEPVIALILCPLPVYRGLLRRFTGRAVYGRVKSWVAPSTGEQTSERTLEAGSDRGLGIHVAGPKAYKSQAYRAGTR